MAVNFIPPDTVTPVALSLLDCVENMLEFRGVDLPGRSGLILGEPAWDDCCEGGGQLWVRVMNLSPTGDPFPLQDTSPRSCGHLLWGAQLGLGLIRCVPVLDDEGNAPPADDLTVSAINAHYDAMVLAEAVTCCFAPAGSLAHPGEVAVLGRWSPLGPLGGCGGGEWTLTAGIKTCACPDLPEEENTDG